MGNMIGTSVSLKPLLGTIRHFVPRFSLLVVLPILALATKVGVGLPSPNIEEMLMEVSALLMQAQ
eukprot:9657499-Prorocentrum_lima.AAC.1